MTRRIGAIHSSFSSILDPLGNPFRMPPVDRLVSFGWHFARDEVTIGAKRLKTQDFLEHIGSDRHPSFTSFREKIFLRSINDSDTAIDDPMCASINDLDITESQSRKKRCAT